MKLHLSIEASTEACSVALKRGEELHVFHEIAPMRHSELLVPVVRDLLAEAGVSANQLDTVVFGSGPGSFTGIRLAAAFAQGIAMPANAECLALNSFDIQAQGIHDYLQTDRMIICQDAHKGQIYAAAYEWREGVRACLIQPCLIRPEQLALPGEGAWSITGNAWFKLSDHMPKWPELMTDRYVVNWLPRAQDAFACLDLAVPFDGAQLNYLREADDWKQVGE